MFLLGVWVSTGRWGGGEGREERRKAEREGMWKGRVGSEQEGGKENVRDGEKGLFREEKGRQI